MNCERATIGAATDEPPLAHLESLHALLDVAARRFESMQHRRHENADNYEAQNAHRHGGDRDSRRRLIDGVQRAAAAAVFAAAFARRERHFCK